MNRLGTNRTIARTALALTLLAGGTSLAAAQAGPADGKGQAGGASHTGGADPSGAKTEAQRDYDRAVTQQMAAGRPAQDDATMSSERSYEGSRGANPSADLAPQERR